MYVYVNLYTTVTSELLCFVCLSCISWDLSKNKIETQFVVDSLSGQTNIFYFNRLHVNIVILLQHVTQAVWDG